MLYSVIAMLDADSAVRINEMRAEIGTEWEVHDNSLPHITIGVYDGAVDVDGLTEWTGEVAGRHARFAAHYAAVGLFLGGCLALFPAFSEELLDLCRDHQRRFGQLCKPHYLLSGGRWMPHTGVLYTDAQAARSRIARLAEMFEAFDAQVVALRVTGYDGAEFFRIAQFELVGGEGETLR